MEISDRVVQRAEELGIKQADIAKQLGVGRSTVFKWFDGVNQPSSKYLDRLADILNTDAYWLLTGDDIRQELLADKDVEEKVKLLQQLGMDLETSISTEELRAIAHQEYERAEAEGDNYKKMRSRETRRVPVLNFVQAGEFCQYFDDAITDEDYPIPCDEGYGDNVFWIRLEGNSMEPDFNSGEMVLVDPDMQPNPGDYVVAIKVGEKETTFKKWRPKGFDDDGIEYYHLVPSNPEYPIIDSRFTPFEVCGVAIERKQKLR